MKNLRFKSTILALAVTAAIGATSLYAQHGEGGPHGRGGDGLEMMMHGKLAEKLNLTAEQRTKLQDMWKSFKESNKAAHEQLRQNEKQLRDMMHSDNYSRAKAEPLIRQNAELQVSMRLAMTDKMQEMKKVLTAEQLAKFKEMRADHIEKMKGRLENRKDRMNKGDRNQGNTREQPAK